MRLLAAFLFCSALPAETLLVLPFFNHAPSQNLDWIGESIAESVHDSLVSEGLLVLDRAERLEACRRLSLRPGAELTHASVLKVGETLDATEVIYGFYELLPAEPGNAPSKGSLRITARILDRQHTRQSGTFIQVGALEDLAALEARLGWQTLNQLLPKTATTEQAFLSARPAPRLDALENYIRGLLASSAEQRQHFFLQAVRLEPDYSQPCFQLGEGYWEKKDYTTAANWLGRVTRSDPHYLEAQFFLGLARYHTGDFAGAAQALQLVAAAVPLNEVLNDLGAAQARLNNFPAAIANFTRALEGDSADPDYHFNLGCALWRSGQSAAAVESFRAAAQRHSEDTEATVMLGRALRPDAPPSVDFKVEDHLRLKTNYEETAYRQLQAELKK
jgi:tetratricopeptide (TPR) repeat protein